MKWMSMREFLRGGYRELDDTTVVSNHGRPVFTVFPYEGMTRKMAKAIVEANKPGAWDKAQPVDDEHKGPSGK